MLCYFYCFAAIVDNAVVVVVVVVSNAISVVFNAVFVVVICCIIINTIFVVSFDIPGVMLIIVTLLSPYEHLVMSLTRSLISFSFLFLLCFFI